MPEEISWQVDDDRKVPFVKECEDVSLLTNANYNRDDEL